MNILIVSGEISGDLYGAHLAASLRTHSPSSTLFAIGGDKLKETADHFLLETAYLNYIGVGALFRQKTLTKAITQCLEDTLSSHTIHQAVLIDFQHHNFTVAAILKKYNIPITTFITPNFWLWGDRRKAQKIAAYSRDIVTIFEKEYALYNAIHPRVHYFGHPMCDLATPAPNHRPDTATVSFFPGSRHQEFSLYLDTMIKVMERLESEHDIPCVIGVSSPRFKDRITAALARSRCSRVTLWEGKPSDLLKNTSLLVCASGTATLEAVLTRTPMIMMAALPHLTYWIAKWIMRIKLPQVTLPNVVAGYEAIPEYVQYDMDADTIFEHVKRGLSRPEMLLKNYEDVIQKLSGTGHVFDAVSALILSDKH